MDFEGKKIAFVGGGQMGTAMMAGMLQRDLVDVEQIVVGDPSEARKTALSDRFGLRVTPDNQEAVRDADVVVLAVKPQFFAKAAASIRGEVGATSLILSIMAGVKISTIVDEMRNERVVRSIPNTPGAIGSGITAWVATQKVMPEWQEAASLILQALGETVQVPDEKYIDMATALSGSGPAYVFLFIEALIDAGVHLGFSRADAEKLVMHTVRGAAEMALESDDPVATLRHNVTSPGGTTAEALYHMERGGLRSLLSRSVWGAYQRSVTLGGGKPRDPDTST